MENLLETPKGISLHTYRQLPAYLRNAVSIKETFQILTEKNRYMDSLTYNEKCFITPERITGVVQRRLYKRGVYMSKEMIQMVLGAEEAYYQYLFLAYID